MKSVMDVDYLAYDGQYGKLMDAACQSLGGRYLVCRSCEPMGMNRPKFSATLTSQSCDHARKAILSHEDFVTIDTGNMENDTSVAVPLTSKVRACASVAVRALLPVDEASEYVGPILVTYRRPGFQSDPTKTVELDVLPRSMVNRLEMRTSLLAYLEPLWRPRIAGLDLPCEKRHTALVSNDWVLIGRELRKHSIKYLSMGYQIKVILSLYTLDQFGQCADCLMFDPDDDIPKV